MNKRIVVLGQIDHQKYTIKSVDSQHFDLGDIKTIGVIPITEQLDIVPQNDIQEFIPNLNHFYDKVTVQGVQTEQVVVKSLLEKQTIKPTANNKYINEVTVEPIVLETAEIQPTTNEQVISPSEGVDGLSEAKIKAVNPADYYKPESVAEVTPTTGTQNIKPVDGSVFNEVRVGAIQTEQTTIKTNGTHTPSAGKFFDKVVVEVADIPAVLQEKTVTPTRQPQTVLPDTNYEGMSKVTVEPIPAEFIVPSGSITATENKTYDVTEVKQVVVAVPEKADAKLIEGSATKNGEYWARDYGADGFEVFTVNVEEKYKEPEGTIEITENGTYDVADFATAEVRVPTGGGGGTGGSLSFYNAEIIVDENGFNVLQLVETSEVGENTYAVGQTNENDTLYVINA